MPPLLATDAPHARPGGTLAADSAPEPAGAGPVGVDLAAVFPGDSEMARRCRAFDWAATPLGPVAGWPRSLRTVAAVVLAARQPMFLWWGPALVQLYNDGYRPSLGGDRHPAALGARGRDFWADAWPAIGPDIEGLLAGGPAVWYEDRLVPIERDGRLQDGYWTYGYTPVPDDAEGVGGVLVTVVETTARVQARAAEAEQARLAAAYQAGRTALLEESFRQAPSFLHVLRGPECVFELANPAYERLVGRRDLVGRSAFEVMPEAMAESEFPARIASVRATGEPFVGRELPVTLARTPGAPPEERLIDLVYLPLREPDGTCVRVLGHGTDVTEQVRARQAAEAARRASEERLRRALAAETVGVLFFGLDGRIQDASATLERMTGYTADELRAVSDWSRLTPPEFMGVTARAAAELAEGGRTAPYEKQWIRKDGTRFWGLFAPTRLSGSGRAAECVEFIIDITAAKATDAALRESEGRLRLALAVAEEARHAAEEARGAAEAARAEADRANRAKSEFLATMSHELRTPLNAIGGYAQLLELGVAGPVTAEQRDYLARLGASGRHLLGLVNDVLDLAKVEAGEVTVARDAATTEAAVTAALDLVRPQAAARGVTLVDGNPDVTAPYVGDEHRVRQILVNLLSNAVKFTPASGTVTVTCALVEAPPSGARLHGAGPWAAVRVADTGIGIAPEHQAAVFEPFHQVEQGAKGPYTRTAGGTGLGLAISRRLARLMGGDLTLESAPGAGSTFTLWLPAVGPRRAHPAVGAGGVAPGGRAAGEGEAHEAAVAVSGAVNPTAEGAAAGTPVARAVRAAHGTPGLVRGLGELGDLLRRQLDALVEAYTGRLRAEPGAPRAHGMKPAELEDHIVTALADLAQSLVIVGEAGSAEVGLLADSVAINVAIAERHGARRLAQGWDEAGLKADYAVLREVLARAVRADARAGGADAEAALGVLLGFVAQSEARAVAAWRLANERATPVRGVPAVAAPTAAPPGHGPVEDAPA